MNSILRIFLFLVLASLGSEFIAPLVAPAHECSERTSTASSVMIAARPVSDGHQTCNHHSPVCEVSGHCHSGHCGVAPLIASPLFTEVVVAQPYASDDTVPSSPHLSGLKRPPIYKA